MTDRLKYAEAAKGLIDGAEPRRIKPGLDVCFDSTGRGGRDRGSRMTWGQVWAPAPKMGHWWIVTADGLTYLWSRRGCTLVSSLGTPIKASA